VNRLTALAPVSWLLARESLDMMEISDEYVIATVDGDIVATARWKV
jgi:hypothetical protein